MNFSLRILESLVSYQAKIPQLTIASILITCLLVRVLKSSDEFILITPERQFKELRPTSDILHCLMSSLLHVHLKLSSFRKVPQIAMSDSSLSKVFLV